MKNTMPPTSGMQASAAAMLEGSPVDFGESEGGGGGGSSGIIYLHTMEGCFVNGFPFSHRRKPIPSRWDFDRSSQLREFLSCSDCPPFVGSHWRRDKRKIGAMAVRHRNRHARRPAFS